MKWRHTSRVDKSDVEDIDDEIESEVAWWAAGTHLRGRMCRGALRRLRPRAARSAAAHYTPVDSPLLS